MTIDEQIAVLQAKKSGKEIQQTCICHPDRWGAKFGDFDFQNNLYRVKPEPREWWIVQSKIEENFNVHIFRDLKDAENYNLGYWGKKPIKVREVLE
jgi:hypothetical protein